MLPRLRSQPPLSRQAVPSQLLQVYIRKIPPQFKTISRGFFKGTQHIRFQQTSAHHGIFRRMFASGRTGKRASSSHSARQAMWAIIGLNTVVFFSWQYAIAQKDSRLVAQMTKNFTCSMRNLKEGRWWTLVTSAFSHNNLVHFMFNMMAFHAFGSIVSGIPGLGAVHIIAMSIGSAIAGSGCWIYHQTRKNPDVAQRAFGNNALNINSSRVALGASGMVMGTGAVATCLMPRAPMLLLFIPFPIPLWVLTIAYAGIDTYYLGSSTSRVGHAAHLGGFFFGILYYTVSLRRFGGIGKIVRGISQR